MYEHLEGGFHNRDWECCTNYVVRLYIRKRIL